MNNYSGLVLGLEIIFLVGSLISNWIIFMKAEEKGWKSLIPIYSTFMFFEIAWDCRAFMCMAILLFTTIILGFIPIAGVVFGIITFLIFVGVYIVFYCKLAQAFGRSGAFAVGLILLNPIFLMILAFGNSKYIGPQ